MYVHYLFVTICVGLISTFEHVSLFQVLSTFFSNFHTSMVLVLGTFLKTFVSAWSWYWV